MDLLTPNILRDHFNQESDRERLVTIFSPTCLVCQYGQGIVSGLFEKINSDRLIGFSIWLPIMNGDNRHCAEGESKYFPDDRVIHTWDPDMISGNLFARTLGLKGVAWDVYMIYAPGVRWEGEQPPKPTFWMHQLPPSTGADGDLLLSPGNLARKVASLLGESESIANSDLAFSLHAGALGAIKQARPQSSLEEVLTAVEADHSDL